VVVATLTTFGANNRHWRWPFGSASSSDAGTGTHYIPLFIPGTALLLSGLR
jgi:hypothetical protein